MPNNQDVVNALLFAHNFGYIDDVEFALLYDVNRPRNLEIPYWQYDQFDLENLSNDECKAEFRFLKEDIYRLINVLQLPLELM